MSLETEAPISQNAPTEALYSLEQFVTNKGDTVQQYTLKWGKEDEDPEKCHPQFVIHTKIMVQAPNPAKGGQMEVQPFPFPIPVQKGTYADLDELMADYDNIVAMGKQAQIKQLQEQSTRMSLTSGLQGMGIPAGGKGGSSIITRDK